MRFIPFLSITILLAIIAGGCSSPSAITESDSPATVIEKVRVRNAAIRTLKGSGRISIDSPEFSGSGNIELRISKPDTALLRITGPFGISIGSGLITSSTFTFYDGYNNTVVRGETNAKNLRRAFRMSMEFDDVLSILTGTFDIAAHGAVLNGTLDGGTYHLRVPIADGSAEYRIDTDYAAVTRYMKRDDEDNIIEDIAFRDFRKQSGYYIPHVVTVLRPNLDESLSIVYDRLSINELPLDFTFTVPGGARKIEL